MTATAANMAELEAALEDLLDAVTDAEAAVMNCADLPELLQYAALAVEFAKISKAKQRYRLARRAV